MNNNLLAALRIVLLALWIGWWSIPVWILKKLGRITWRDRLICLCYAGILPLAGVRLKTTGQLTDQRPLLLVTNHLSYLDICILGSQAPVRFTPKSEVASWPFIGGICRLCDAIFINRRPDKLKENSRLLQLALAKGDVVCLFPESTTGDGRHLLPFKSGFFSLAEEPIEGQELVIQPAAIVYTRIRNLPIDSTQWPQIAWYGDMYLMPHLWAVLKIGAISAELIYLPPVTLSQYSDRKRLAEHCRRVITEAIGSAKAKGLTIK